MCVCVRVCVWICVYLCLNLLMNMFMIVFMFIRFCIVFLHKFIVISILFASSIGDADAIKSPVILHRLKHTSAYKMNIFTNFTHDWTLTITHKHTQTHTSTYTHVNEEQSAMRWTICALFAPNPRKVTLLFISLKHTLIFNRFTWFLMCGSFNVLTLCLASLKLF